MSFPLATLLGLHNTESEGFPCALITGPSKCGKSSLAFALAQELACSRMSHGDVWFLCSKLKIESSMPLPVSINGTIISDDDKGLEHVQMKYFSNEAELRWWILHINHLPPKFSPPSAIIIDSIEDFLEGAKSNEQFLRSFMHLMALLRHASSFLTEHLRHLCPVIVVLSGEQDSLSTPMGSFLTRELEGNIHVCSRGSIRNHRLELEVPYTCIEHPNGSHFSLSP